MSEKDITPPRYTRSSSARHPHMHAVPEDTLTAYSTRTPASLRPDAKCEDLACRRQQERNRYERARFLYENYDKEIPGGLICYDCGVFHPRILPGKQNLHTYPVHCKASRKPKSIKDFLQHRTESPAVIICCSYYVPWLQVHQTARSLRHGPQYGAVTLNHHQTYRNVLGIRFPWQIASKALLVDDRLLVRAQHFAPIGTVIESTPTPVTDTGADRICPHTRSTFLYSNKRANEILEACRVFCRAHAAASSLPPSPSNKTPDTSEAGILDGFVHSCYRCSRCPTEYVVEILPRACFAGDHMIGRTEKRGRKYVVCLSQYVDFGACNAPDEREWRALSTWPAERPKGDWGPVGQRWVEGEEAQVDLSGMEPIRARFERALRGLGESNS